MHPRIQKIKKLKISVCKYYKRRFHSLSTNDKDRILRTLSKLNTENIYRLTFEQTEERLQKLDILEIESRYLYCQLFKRIVRLDISVNGAKIKLQGVKFPPRQKNDDLKINKPSKIVSISKFTYKCILAPLSVILTFS